MPLMAGGSVPGSYYVLAAILLWSSLGVVIRLAGVDVHELIFYSVLFSLPLQGVIISWKKNWGGFPGRGAGMGVFLLGPITLINTFTFFYALKHATIANALLTHYMAPVFVAALAFAFLGEPLTKKLVAAIALSTAGLWVLLDVSVVELISTALGDKDEGSLGLASGLLSGVAYALLVLVARVYSQRYDPLVLTFMQNVMVSLMLLPFIREFPVHALPSFAIVGVVHSTLAPILYFKGLATVQANGAAILGYVEPVSAIILGVIFLGEYPPPVAVGGGMMILLAGYITIAEGKVKRSLS